jgi:hypothetical protein
MGTAALVYESNESSNLNEVARSQAATSVSVA